MTEIGLRDDVTRAAYRQSRNHHMKTKDPR